MTSAFISTPRASFKPQHVQAVHIFSSLDHPPFVDRLAGGPPPPETFGVEVMLQMFGRAPGPSGVGMATVVADSHMGREAAKILRREIVDQVDKVLETLSQGGELPGELPPRTIFPGI